MLTLNKCSYIIKKNKRFERSDIMKKHYVLKNKRKFLNFLLVLSIILSCIILASNSYAYKEKQYDIVIVEAGDTLWDIARSYNKNQDIRKTIYEIRKINGLSENSIIYTGDELKVPV